MPAKAPIKSIDLDRQEGVRAQWKATTFSGANRVLSDWAQTAPRTLGYDKVSVAVEWTNGTRYVFRLDLKHPESGEEPDVSKDIVHFVDFVLGRIRNPNWSDKQQECVLARYKTNGGLAIAEQLDQRCLLADV